MIDFTKITSLSIGGRTVSKLSIGGRDVWEGDKVDYLTFTSSGDSTIALVKLGSPNDVSLQYKKDGSWTDYAVDEVINLSDGQSVKFRGDNAAFSTDGNNYYRFEALGSIAASGSIMTLLDRTDAARTVPNNAFRNLFNGCSALTSAPKLPAMSVGEHSYDAMFNGCTSLLEGPDLPATTVGTGGYAAMFRTCSALTSCTETLPALAPGDQGYIIMFSGCKSLLKAPDIKASGRLLPNVFNAMFNDCSSLAEAQQTFYFTAQNTTACYQMFNGCTSLKRAPKIVCPTSGISDSGLREMFNGCSSLEYVEVSFSSWKSSYMQSTTNWLSGVAESGKFICPNALPDTRGVSNIPYHWVKTSDPAYEPDVDHLTFTAEEDNSTVCLSAIGEPVALNLEYSIDGETWQGFEVGQTYALANAGDYMKLRATNVGNKQGLGQSDANKHRFVMTGAVAASGSIMTLYDKYDMTRAMTAFGFKQLFKDCTALKKAPELRATTVTAAQAYNQMFNNTGITEIPVFSATNVGQDCINGIFQECAALETVKVPYIATTGVSIWGSAFKDCTSLREAELEGRGNNTYDYQYMFTGCTSLSCIKVDWTSWNTRAHAMEHWVQNVAPEGVFVCPDELPEEYGDTRIPNGWTKVVPPEYLTVTSMEDGSTFAIKKWSNPADVSLEYSTDDGETWQDFTIGQAYVIDSGSSMMLRAPYGIKNEQCFGQPDAGNYYVMATGNMTLNGNIMTLVDFYGASRTVTPNGFINFFKGQTAIVDIQDLKLPATTVGAQGYMGMFSGTNCVAAPLLPALMLGEGCYRNMFRDCTSLTVPPDLPAQPAERSYQDMFNSSGLQTVPYLGANYVPDYAYCGMFSGCMSLTTAMYELPAETVGAYAYAYMFKDCQNLQTVPRINAQTVGAYSTAYMFSGCSAITDASEMSLLAEDLSNAGDCYHGMFLNCTSLATAPTLCATLLGISCYYSMFEGCISLLDAPNLQCTGMRGYCYACMFKGCTSLKRIQTAQTDWTTVGNANANWVYGVGDSGTFVCPDELPEEYGNNRIPTGWMKESA